jgi:hypothetical protein
MSDSQETSPGTSPEQRRPPGTESYLYERAIDALIVFAARFVRTALLLLRHPWKGADRLLADLDEDRPHLMRPLGFLAIAYMMLVMVVWKIASVPSAQKALDLATGVAGGLGGSEVDLLQSVLLAPLPGVLLVAFLSSQASRRLLGLDAPQRRPATAMLQYTVGHGLIVISLGLILLKIIGTPYLEWEQQPWAATEGDSFDGAMMFYTIGLGGLITMMLVTLTVFVLLPMYRASKRIHGLSSLGLARRGMYVLLGPTLLTTMLGVFLALIPLGVFLSTQPFAVKAEHSYYNAGEARFLLRLEAPRHQPAVVAGWRAYWVPSETNIFGCEYLAPDGDVLDKLGDRIEQPGVFVPPQAALQVRMISPTSRSYRYPSETLVLDPGEQAWVQVSTDVGGMREEAALGPIKRGGALDKILICYALAYQKGPRVWNKAASLDYWVERGS